MSQLSFLFLFGTFFLALRTLCLLLVFIKLPVFSFISRPTVTLDLMLVKRVKQGFFLMFLLLWQIPERQKWREENLCFKRFLSMADSFCSYTACCKVEAAWEEAVARLRQRGRRPWQGRDSLEEATAEKSCLPHGIQEASRVNSGPGSQSQLAPRGPHCL